MRSVNATPVLLSVLAACAAPDETPRAYIVHVLEMPAPVDDAVPGADLDDLDAEAGDGAPGARCDRRHPDHVSPYDGRAAIDASLNHVVPTVDALVEGAGRTLDRAIAERIASGELLLAFEVVPGPPLRVTAYRVEPVGELVLVDGRLAPDQAFTPVAELGRGEGELVDGRARVGLGTFAAPLPVGVDAPDGGAFELLAAPLQGVEVRFDDGRRLERGELGGMMDVEDYILRIPPSTDPIVSPHEVLRELADVAPRAADPTRCTYLSVGLAFEAIPARLELAP